MDDRPLRIGLRSLVVLPGIARHLSSQDRPAARLVDLLVREVGVGEHAIGGILDRHGATDGVGDLVGQGEQVRGWPQGKAAHAREVRVACGGDQPVEMPPRHVLGRDEDGNSDFVTGRLDDAWLDAAGLHDHGGAAPSPRLANHVPELGLAAGHVRGEEDPVGRHRPLVVQGGDQGPGEGGTGASGRADKVEDVTAEGLDQVADGNRPRRPRRQRRRALVLHVGRGLHSTDGNALGWKRPRPPIKIQGRGGSPALP